MTECYRMMKDCIGKTVLEIEEDEVEGEMYEKSAPSGFIIVFTDGTRMKISTGHRLESYVVAVRLED